MKMITILAGLGAVLLCGGAVLAEPPTSADKTASPSAAAADVAEFDKRMTQAQENMDKMRAQMERLRQAQDPQARQQLLREHMATMQSTMGMMDGMWNTCMMGSRGGAMMGGPMMGHMMGWHDMNDYYSGLTPEQMKQHQYMMDRYMGMQQMMMDHMMQNQKWMMSPAK